MKTNMGRIYMMIKVFVEILLSDKHFHPFILFMLENFYEIFLKKLLSSYHTMHVMKV